MGRRSTTEGSWDDNAKKQHFMYFFVTFCVLGCFSVGCYLRKEGM